MSSHDYYNQGQGGYGGGGYPQHPPQVRHHSSAIHVSPTVADYQIPLPRATTYLSSALPATRNTPQGRELWAGLGRAELS